MPRLSPATAMKVTDGTRFHSATGRHVPTRWGLHVAMTGSRYLFCGGTGMPGIFTLTAPRWFRLVKYSVFQSSPPKARLVVAGAPCTMRPSFLPCRIHDP